MTLSYYSSGKKKGIKMRSFVKSKGNVFEYNQKPLKLRGFGIGTWLNMEHFMVGLPTSDKMIREAFRDVLGTTDSKQSLEGFSQNFFGHEDLQLLKSLGVNFIRLPFNYRLLLDDNQSYKIKQDGFKKLDRLLDLCEEYQIFVMLDLHTTPGGQNPDWHADNDLGVPLFWQYEVWRQQIIWLWGQIAKRYAERTYLMGYDLLNEPAFADWNVLNTFYEQTIQEIRHFDKNHTIVLEGDMFSMEFQGLKVFEDDNLAIGFHYYPTVWSPELLNPQLERVQRRKEIGIGLDRIVTQCKKFGWPLICGEFGFGRDCGETALTEQLLEDTLFLLEERNLNWALWSYKDVGFMSLAVLKKDSLWWQISNQIAVNWNQDMEKEQARILLDVMKEKWFPQLTEEEGYILQFRIRATSYLLQKNHILIPVLKKFSPEDLIKAGEAFKLENCEIDEYYVKLIERTLLCD